MPWTKEHLAWLVHTKKVLTISCGTKVPVWEFRHKKDDKILTAWAKHFRNHYCRDTEIDILRDGTAHSRADYLKIIKFPDRLAAPGPSIRSGDLAEILVADYVEFVLGYWVPRTRYGDRVIRNESTKGSDIIGFKILKPGKESKKDILALFEAKAQLSAKQKESRLQDAVDGSAKDHLRMAESLNAIKQRLFLDKDFDGMARVQRFQNPGDHPYTVQFGAVAVFSTAAYSSKTERTAKTTSHPFRDSLALMIIRGDDLMELVHALYERAANEA